MLNSLFESYSKIEGATAESNIRGGVISVSVTVKFFTFSKYLQKPFISELVEIAQKRWHPVSCW